MELSWPMKIRIGAAAGVGVLLIGILAWPLVSPADPFMVVSMPSFSGAVLLIGLAVLVGFLAYFVAYPYGGQIGVLAVPAGLAVWAVRCGGMSNLLAINPEVAGRQDIFAMLKWEPIFWIAVVVCGFGGVFLAQKVYGPKNAMQEDEAGGEESKKHETKLNKYLSMLVAFVGSGLIAQFFIKILAQDVSVLDNRLGSVVGQPSVGQIALAVSVSFCIAAFIVKKFLNASYVWPILSCALVTFFAITTYAKLEVLELLAINWPPVFFANAITSILPVQIVAFGAIGSIGGYWLAIQFNYWRQYAEK